jgi:tetratricopeptide (TPR) repeat protein
MILLLALLAAAEPALSPAPSPAPVSIPAEDIVLALRKARIARDVSDAATEGKLLDEILAAHPDDVTCLAAAIEQRTRTDSGGDTVRALRTRLLEALAKPGGIVPYPFLVDIAIDPKSSDEELARIAEILRTQPGEAQERVARLKLRIDVLERLHRDEERLAEIERLSTLDSDPSILWTLLAEYHRMERWEDLLRTLDRTRQEGTPWAGGWTRLEALAALGRLDDLEKEASALIDRMPKTGPPQLNPNVELAAPNAVLGFFPTIFRLVDEGRTEAAAKLAAKLEAASPGNEAIARLRVLLFGTAEERQAFLGKQASASLASADAGKVRADADQRLLAKDFTTAHDLYRRAHELDASLDGDVFFWFNYGLSCIETASWAEAEDAMTRAMGLDPKMSRALAHRARARVMLGKIPEGIADAQAALAIDPKSKHACYAMYLAYQTLGETTKAAEWLARFKTP